MNYLVDGFIIELTIERVVRTVGSGASLEAVNYWAHSLKELVFPPVVASCSLCILAAMR